jgi:hypothetical protein
MKSIILLFLLFPLMASAIEGSPQGSKLHLVSGSQNTGGFACYDTCINIQVPSGGWRGFPITIYPGTNDYLSNTILSTDSTDQSKLGEMTIDNMTMTVNPTRSSLVYLQVIPAVSCSDNTTPCTQDTPAAPLWFTPDNNNPYTRWVIADSDFMPKWHISKFVKSGDLGHMEVTGFFYDLNCPGCTAWPHRAPVRLVLNGRIGTPDTKPIINYVRSMKGSTAGHIYGINFTLDGTTAVYYNGQFAPALVLSATHIQFMKPANDNPGANVRVVSPSGEYTYKFY